ncbi:ParB/RepB/Spo0J family partition protein [Chloroflexota bacterium]
MEKGMTIEEIPISKIKVGEYKVRQHVSKEFVEKLTSSLKQVGLLQPPVVTRKDGKYQLVAGHARLQTLREMGDKTVTAVVLKDNSVARKAALVENLVRSEMNPLEKARGISRLKYEGVSQNKIAEFLSISESEVANLLAITKLEPEVLYRCNSGQLKFGHLKALLPLKDKRDAQKGIVAALLAMDQKQRTVRAAEALVRDERARIKGDHTKYTKLIWPGNGKLRIERLAKSQRLVVDFSGIQELCDLMKQLMDSNPGIFSSDFPCGNSAEDCVSDESKGVSQPTGIGTSKTAYEALIDKRGDCHNGIK